MRITFLLCSTAVNHVFKRLCKTAGHSSSLSSARSKMCRWGHNWSHKCPSSSAFLSNLCLFLFVWERRGGGCRMSTLFNQPTESRNAKALICAAVSSHPLKVGFFKCFNHLRRTVSNTIIAEYDTSSAMQMVKVSIQTQHEFYSKQMAI